MKRRRYISWKTKLAATLRELAQIPYEDAKKMTTHQIISLFHFDHGILHAIDPIDDHWNLTPRLINEHRAKSRSDTSTVAKSKRIGKDWQDFVKRNFGVKKQPPPPSRWPKRRKSNA